MGKDLWFANFERALAEREDRYPPKRAYELAAKDADEMTAHHVADMADAARLERKEGGR